VTASELAFMALGIVLGAASGAALIVLFGTRLPRREIRVIVTRDVLPRRSETLSQDAFVTSAGEPARGGPADRRSDDRDGIEPRPSTPPTTRVPGIAIPVLPAPMATPNPSRDRTIVPTAPGRSVSGASPSAPPKPRISTTVPVGYASPVSSPDGNPDSRPTVSPVTVTIEEDADRELEQERHRRAWGSAMERMLRGEHRAMAEVLDRVAGPDSRQRREWERLLGGLVEAMAEVAVRESVIDFPMGTAFWDSFTVEQCRRAVGALATMGYDYDGRDGWVDRRVPAYRDLSQALADVGIDPRRIRAWPNSADIAGLFVGARPAPEELLAAAGPAYSVDDVRELVGDRAEELTDLWLAWDVARPALFEEHRTPT
jgi:hypothetical protein